MNKLFLSFLVIITLFSSESRGGEPIIIKVKGTYGIIDEGVNQGVAEGQILYVKRSSDAGLIETGKVEVIRTTANRAAVQQISNIEKPFLQKGDKLYTSPGNETKYFGYLQPYNADQPESIEHHTTTKNNEPSLINSSYKESSIPLPEYNKFYTSKPGIKVPWVGFEVGTVIPAGDLAEIYSLSFRLGASYMVSAGKNLSLGIEINNTFLNSSSVSNSNFNSIRNTSASILEGLVVLRRFIENGIFIEGGGGIYRPQIRTVSPDDVKTIFSSTKIGFFGGTGLFVRTGEYAGLSLKVRMHNYFDGSSRQYFGITGGFRFKL